MKKGKTMIRNLKALGLALVAVFAMSALVASAASAAEFHSEGENTTVSASQTTVQVFKTTAGEVTCAKASFSGTQATKTAVKISGVSAVYSECHIIFFGSTFKATVNMNGCTYTLYASGAADLVCAAGKEVEVTAAECTVKVPGQTGLKTVNYSNKENKHVDLSLNLGGIKYSHSGFACGTGSGTTGTLTGGATAEGNKGKIWFE
jgi:hypothetical protein